MNLFKNIIISAPFGNYFNRDYCTSTLGTFTLNYRGGFWKRLYKVLTTVRYNRRTQSWINKLGLPNPGIDSLFPKTPVWPNEIMYYDKIISILGFNRDEWIKLAYKIQNLRPLACELNLSCPNINHQQYLNDVYPLLDILNNDHSLTNIPIIAKLPPIEPMKLAIPLYENGVRIFHCCNTIPSPRGGVSGKLLKPFSLWAIFELRQKYGNSIKIIGGGGITNNDDVIDYYNTGADYISVGSMLFNPFNWHKLKEFDNIGNGIL